MHWPKVSSCVFALSLAVFSCVAAGERAADTTPWYEIGATGISAASSSDDPPTAGLFSFDVAVGMRAGRGRISMVLEAESCPLVTTGASGNGHMNRDPSALGDGQAWLTEFRYQFENALGEWAIGYIESKGYLDTSSVANDDKSQFANAVFVNNPTIALPGSGLGLYWLHPSPSEKGGYSALLAQSGDNGAFLAVETWRNVGSVVTRLGAWRNTARLPDMTGSQDLGGGEGLYAAIDGRLSMMLWNVRAGLARRARGARESFISAAAEWPRERRTLGVAVGYRILNGRTLWRGRDRSSHAELYYRLALSGGIYLTPSIQFSEISGAGDNTSGLTAGVRFRMTI